MPGPANIVTILFTVRSPGARSREDCRAGTVNEQRALVRAGALSVKMWQSGVNRVGSSNTPA